jgi:hypothetical protein
LPEPGRSWIRRISVGLGWGALLLGSGSGIAVGTAERCEEHRFSAVASTVPASGDLSFYGPFGQGSWILIAPLDMSLPIGGPIDLADTAIVFSRTIGANSSAVEYRGEIGARLTVLSEGATGQLAGRYALLQEPAGLGAGRKAVMVLKGGKFVEYCRYRDSG